MFIYCNLPLFLEKTSPEEIDTEKVPLWEQESVVCVSTDVEDEVEMTSQHSSESFMCGAKLPMKEVKSRKSQIP